MEVNKYEYARMTPPYRVEGIASESLLSHGGLE